MSCLGSKHELLQVADHVIAHYYQRVPFVRNHPQAIDLDMLVMERNRQISRRMDTHGIIVVERFATFHYY